MRTATVRRAAFAIWALSLTAWLVYLGLEAYLNVCEFATGTSVYGEAGWSFVPPGATCMWEAEQLEKEFGGGVSHVDAPSVDRLGIALVFVLWPLTLAWMGRSARAAEP